MHPRIRPLALALAGLLCLTPLALAQDVATTGTLSGSGSASLGKAQGAADAAARTGDLRATLDATTEEARGAAGLDLAHADPTAEEGFWARLGLHLSAVVARLGELLGRDAATDADANVGVTANGLDLDARAGDLTLGADATAQATPADDARAKVHETRSAVEGKLPATPTLPVG